MQLPRHRRLCVVVGVTVRVVLVTPGLLSVSGCGHVSSLKCGLNHGDHVAVVVRDNCCGRGRECCRRMGRLLGIVVFPVVTVGWCCVGRKSGWSRGWCLVGWCCWRRGGPGLVAWCAGFRVRASVRARGAGGGTIVCRQTSAQGDGDLCVRGTRLHAIGIVGGVAICLLLGTALGAVGSDLPVLVPWVAVDAAQVVPDDAVVVERVLVLHDVAAKVVTILAQLDAPAVIVGKRCPLLSVRVTCGQSLVDLLVAATRCWDVAQVHVVIALVDDLCPSNRASSD